MAAIVEAAGNLVFRLIMNSVRELYLPRIAAFGGIIARRDDWAPLYERDRRSDRRAATARTRRAAIAELAAEQERAMLGAP